MLKKLYFILTFFVAIILIGCEEEPVTASNGVSNKISGETHMVESIGSAQINPKVRVFKDSSNSKLVSGLRKIETIKGFSSNEEGHSSGVFSIEAKSGTWEGDWTGTTNSSGTTIIAVGYNMDDRDQSCEWRYYFPSSQEGKRGTYSAVISTNRF